MKKEFFTNFERLEAMEDRIGITIEGLNGEFEKEGGNIDLKIFCEIHAKDTELSSDVELVASAFDSEGLIIGHESDYLNSDSFYGLDTVSLHFFDLSSIPSKVRIYPKKS